MRQLWYEGSGKEPPIVDEGSLAIGSKEVPAKGNFRTTSKTKSPNQVYCEQTLDKAKRLENFEPMLRMFNDSGFAVFDMSTLFYGFSRRMITAHYRSEFPASPGLTFQFLFYHFPYASARDAAFNTEVVRILMLIYRHLNSKMSNITSEFVNNLKHRQVKKKSYI
uniref:Uncharacterized protein n=1 Tax=Rhabditophanes sp. KR3021 TaxID=114890 RepID=A0AC35UCN8_9BILA